MTTNNFFKLGFFALIGVVVFVYVFKGGKQEDKLYLNSLQNQIEQLEGEKERLEEIVLYERTKVSHFEDSLSYITDSLVQNAERQKQIAKYYERKANNVKSYSVSELSSFFTDRYPERLRSDTTTMESNSGRN